MNTELLQQAIRGSEEGRLTFPEVVTMLNRAGVESYLVDLLRGDDTFYFCAGGTHVEPMRATGAPVAQGFAVEQLRTAILDAQADAIRYPEFLERIRAAGVVAYRVHLTGRRALYFGRKGETHVEEFPAPPQN